MNLPYHFPDPREEAYRRAQEFQRLSATERVAAILDTIQTGLYFLSVSPRRADMDRVFLEREAAWQRLQKELIRVTANDSSGFAHMHLGGSAVLVE